MGASASTPSAPPAASPSPHREELQACAAALGQLTDFLDNSKGVPASNRQRWLDELQTQLAAAVGALPTAAPWGAPDEQAVLRAVLQALHALATYRHPSDAGWLKALVAVLGAPSFAIPACGHDPSDQRAFALWLRGTGGSQQSALIRLLRLL
jgi:hypothetical protein